MVVSLSFITGVMVGFEFVDHEDSSYFVLDLFIIRILVEKM